MIIPSTIRNAVFSGVSEDWFMYNKINIADILIDNSVISEIIFGLTVFTP